MMHFKATLVMSMPSKNYSRIIVKADGYRLHRIIDNLVYTAITNQVKGVIEMKMEIKNEGRVLFSVINKRNELLEERAKMVFENNGIADDWHNHLDSTGLAFKLARDLTNAMGGSVSLVKLEEKRMGICIELPINKFDSLCKSGSKSDITALMN
jgi:K+-sensing histidine kinase KdpD